MKRSGLSSLIFSVLGLVSVLWLIRCGGLDEGSTSTDPFERAYANYLSDCASCHSPGNSIFQDVDLDMSSVAAAKASLRSTAEIPGKPNCSALRYVVPGDPNGSMLIAVLDETVRAEFEAMTGCSPLYLSLMSTDPPSASVLADIVAWINNGAN